ncbi:MAG: type III-B CRISPR module-associated protein Cmr5 [Chloroflexi bacterium]|nr:type III-B CRISPR module-associated protein Cmr5 [Chloroflexota bacterium]
MSIKQTMEQFRARRAQECVMAIKRTGDDKMRREYSSLARSAPADIQSNGLGQTLAFWRSKREKGEAHRCIYSHVGNWICDRMPGWKNGDVLTKLIDEETSVSDYRRAGEEAMSFLVWLKRFVEAEIETEG